MSGSSQCAYSFDPEAWAADRQYDPLVEDDILTDGRWECDRPIDDDEERCVFHRPTDGKEPEAVRRQFVEDLSTKPTETTSEAVADNRFIGTRFPEFDFSNRVLRLDNNVPIDLRFAHVAGELRCDQFVVENVFRFEGTVVEGEADFRRCRAGAVVDFSGCVFRRGADFSDSRFEDHVWGMETQYGDTTTFDRMEVWGDLCLAGAIVEGDLRVASSQIEGIVCLSRIDCQGGLLFDDNDVGKDVWCVGSTVRSERASGNLVSKNGIGNDLRITESTFNGKLSLEKTTVDGELLIAGTTVDSRWLDFTNCDVHAGRLEQPPTGHVMYDFTEATLGDVTIDPQSGNEFEFFRLENTTFERFDFGRHRSLLHRSDWTIHTVRDGTDSEAEPVGPLGRLSGRLGWVRDSIVPGKTPESTDHVVNETTYLKAKNGANRMGDNKAAAEFFMKEMSFRRRRHAETALNGSDGRSGLFARLKSAGAWVANVGLAVTTGYGEKPHRVLLSAGVIILAFAAFYRALPSNHYTDPIGGSEALLLSFQSFVAFILGETPVGNSYLLQLTSTAEGFIGAFLVALSVFALTRSIHR